METEKIIKEIVAATHSHSQKGDVSEYLYQQGFFDGGPIPSALKERSKFPSGGNPVDTKNLFLKQNPN